MSKRKYYSITALVFCIAVFFYSASISERWKGWMGYICWDVAGYYTWLPSIFYDDPGQLNKSPVLESKYHPFGGDFYGASKGQKGKYVFKYTYGTALMYLPAFAFAHCWAEIDKYPADGYSFPYQISLLIYSILISGIGLFFIRKVLLQYFEDEIVAIAIIILCLATNYFQFVAMSGAYTHNFLFTLYAILIYLTIKWYEKPSLVISLLIGSVIGLAAVTRPTEIISVVIPVLWGVSSIEKLRERFGYFISNYSIALAAIVPAFLFIFLQLLYWKVYAGSWFYWSYSPEEGFDWLRPHIYNGVLSYRKGWLMYTPVMVLSLIGFLWLYRTDKKIFYPVIIYFLLHFYISFAWKSWEYGGSFSQRSMIQAYAALMFPLCAFLSYAFSGKILLKAITTGFLLFCLWLNLLMTWQANAKDGFMDTVSMNRAYYWRIFGRTHIRLSDRKLLDCDEEIPHSSEPLLKGVSLPFSQFLKDDRNNSKDKKGILLSENNKNNPAISIPIKQYRASWFRIYTNACIYSMEWDIWKRTQMIAELKKGKTIIKTNFICMQRIMEENKWQQLFIDINNNANADTLNIRFFQPVSDKTVYIDSIGVAYLPSK